MKKAENIKELEKQRMKILFTWNEIEELNEEYAFSDDCLTELQGRLSSKLLNINKLIRESKTD